LNPKQFFMDNETPNLFRPKFINALKQVFLTEYGAMLAHYSPNEQLLLTNHLLYTLDKLKSYSSAMLQEQDLEMVQHYQGYREKEDQLLKQLGSRLVTYLQYHFHDYFSTDIILCLRKIIPDDEFKAMPRQQQGLSEEEIKSFVQMCRYELQNRQRKLLLADAHKETSAGQVGNEALDGAVSSGLLVTRGQQLLMIYYLLRSLGVELRSTASVSDVARLVHAIAGIGLTKLTNSDVYKKLREISDDKTRKMEDLLLVRTYFDKAGVYQAVALIDEELK
jgi:hypothetical protein